MSNRIQELEEDDLESPPIELAKELLHRWKFFRPSPDLVRDVLRLNDKLGGAYFEGEYAALDAREGGGSGEEPVKDVNWFRWLFRQASDAISHGEDEGTERRGESEEDELSFFRASISERVFNHLAMLARSRHAAQGGAFSIREELTAELAEKIGLGLYLHRKTSSELRAEAESVLLRLAGEFQHWLVVLKGGRFGTTWGQIYASGNRVVGVGDDSLNLILTPDVEAGEAAGGDT
jgi:hypothetical protein